VLYQKSKAKNITSNRGDIKNIVEKAIDQMATVVGATLGPGGRPVLIERGDLAPLVTKDGVTVARHLGVANSEANLIIDAAKEICLNTAKQAGDGTTTAIVLANAITKHGLQFLQDNPKYNPQRMVNELNQVYENVIVQFLKKNAKKIKTEEELIDVATISANGDLKIAKASVEAVMAAGEDGTVLVEESQDNSIRVETMDGFIVTSGLRDLGSIGPAFINDKTNQQSKMDNGIVFLYDGTINDLKVMSTIQTALEGGSDFYGMPIVIFAHGFADVVLDKCAKSTKGGYTIVPVKTPMGGYANSRTMFLHDMAAYTGGFVFDPVTIENGVMSEDGSYGFGRFTKAKVNLYEGLVTSDVAADVIDARVSELKAIAEVAPSEKDKMHIKAAIGKLTGGVSTIWVGGGSELEAREKKARVEDAVEAVRSAIAEGIIPGGCGVHLVLSNIIANHPEYKQSWSIMVEALKAPFGLLLSNCGEDVDSVWGAIRDSVINRTTPPSLIFDANRHELVDPIAAGIIEPAKVCRVSIGNALSVASLLITLGGLVVVPRDAGLEGQLEMSKQAFRDMFHGEDVGQL
jgi:chaperonin GroEL